MKNLIPFFMITLGSFLLNTQVHKAQSDFANRMRYNNENQKLIAEKFDENRVVFMGNSITEGWISADPDFFVQNSNFINRGISGQTTDQMLLRFRQDVINLSPKTAVILAGTNDIAENTGHISLQNILGNIKSMVELAEANKIKVILCSVLPTKDFSWRKGLEPGPKIVKLNKMLKELCEQKKIIFVDYYSEMNDGNLGLKSNLSGDGVHPNLEGYKVMQNILLKVIN